MFFIDEPSDRSKLISARAENDELREQLAKANERVKELELIVVAITHADETGYVDGEGFVEGWGQVCDETKALLKKFALEQKIEAFEKYADMCEAFRTEPSIESLRHHIEQLRKGGE